MSNWYRLAKNKLRPEDIFSFYSFLASNENIAEPENIDLLINLAEQMNYMKRYYTEHILQEVAEELRHALFPSRSFDVDYILENIYYGNYDEEGMEFIEPNYTFEEWCELYKDLVTSIEEQEEEEGSEYWSTDNYLYEVYSSEMENALSLDEPFYSDIKNLAYEIESGNLSSSVVRKANYYFTHLPWQYNYGGPVWGHVLMWVKRLIDTPFVDINLLYANPKQAYRQMINLATILDVIHSLEHNTDMVLSRLPMGEGKWMKWLFDLAKYSASPLGLSYLSREPSMMRVMKDIYRIYPEYSKEPKTIVEFLLRTLNNMDDYRREYFLKNVDDPRILSALAKNADIPILMSLIGNYNIYEALSEEDLYLLFKKIIDSVGAEAFAERFWATGPSPASVHIPERILNILKNIKGLNTWVKYHR